MSKRTFRNELLSCTVETVKNLIKSYADDSVSILSATPIRMFMKGEFEKDEHQDVENIFLYLNEILNIGKKDPTIVANSFEILHTSEKSCRNNGCINQYYRSANAMYTLQIDISNITNNNLQNGLNVLLNEEWELSVDKKCPGCENYIYEKNMIQSTSKYVAILLKVFEYDREAKISRKLGDLKIKNVSTQRFEIGPNNRQYRAFGGIFHAGNTVLGRHYTVYVKCGDDRHISKKNRRRTNLYAIISKLTYTKIK